MMADVAIVGAGAAGLMTAITVGRRAAGARVVLLDGAARPGAKILVSGGGRCNVTNVRVTPDDFRGGSRNTIRRVLAAMPVDDTIRFFHEIGVSLHEEPNGKLFPDSNSARTVLQALLAEAERVGVRLESGRRVQRIERRDDAFVLTTPEETYTARRCVLATGGLSLPKTGSDGGGYELAQALGHRIIPTTPALAPLVLDGDFHTALSGITQDVQITLHVPGEKPLRHRGSLLWTHFGISGPVVLDVSGAWHRARLEGKTPRATLSLLPDHTFESADAWLANLTTDRPRVTIATVLADLLPARLVDAILRQQQVPRDVPIAHLARDLRRRLIHALIELPLPVRDSRGYNFAEVTAGGVPLDEIDPRTMESRACPGLHLAGEILDVDGRIGGFNFQWAWSSGFVAGSAIASAIAPIPPRPAT